MKSILLIFCVMLSYGTYAQQYLIKYDIHAKRSNYFVVENKDTVKIKNIDPNKNRRIVLQVDNYNPFYWNARVTAFKTPVEEEIGYSSAFNPFSVLAGGLGNIMGSLPKLDMPSNRGGGPERGDMDLSTYQFLTAADQYANYYEDMVIMNEKLEELQIVKLQLQELKYDIVHTEEEIKSDARNTVKKALGTDKLDLGSVLDIGKNYNGRLNRALVGVQNEMGRMQQQIKLVNTSTVYEDKTLGEIEQSATRSYQGLSSISNKINQNPNLMMDIVAEISALYKEIIEADYTFMYSVNNNDAITDLKLELYPKLSSEEADTVVHYFELNKRKNLRIRNSVGLSFSYFSENNTQYFIDNNSVVRKSDKDLFTPLLSTYIHFYGGTKGNIKWGGALGFGIPLQGDQKDVNFLLGLTAGIGKNEPILLSAGIAGAKVNKLSNGNKLNEVTAEVDPDNLTTARYDLGGFLGVSFNLSGLGLGGGRRN